MIARNRKNRTRSQDGRPLRRVKRRFLVVRYELHAEHDLGMVQLAAKVILLRRF